MNGNRQDRFQKDLFGFTRTDAVTGKVVPKQGKSTGPVSLTPGSTVQRRLNRRQHRHSDDSGAQIAFQHTVLCQTSMPYRNPW